jgi:hypothetical protein
MEAPVPSTWEAQGSIPSTNKEKKTERETMTALGSDEIDT